MVHSMTAYARAARAVDSLSVEIEIRSYNSRHLDLVVRLPHGYEGLEEPVKRLTSERIYRGRVDIRIRIDHPMDESQAFQLNEPRAQAYHAALVKLRDLLGLTEEISLKLVMGIGEIVKPLEAELNPKQYLPAVEACLTDALDQLCVMRRNEGEFIAADFKQRLQTLEQGLFQIEQDSADMLTHYRDRLKERIAVLTEGVITPDPDRVAQEAAFLADKCDISEEIVRSRSHVAQFRAIMQAGEPGGRKLNFLIQELHREFNTMGAKTEKANVSHIIVALKSELEKLREQVQNVE